MKINGKNVYPAALPPEDKEFLLKVYKQLYSGMSQIESTRFDTPEAKDLMRVGFLDELMGGHSEDLNDMQEAKWQAEYEQELHSLPR